MEYLLINVTVHIKLIFLDYIYVVFFRRVIKICWLFCFLEEVCFRMKKMRNFDRVVVVFLLMCCAGVFCRCCDVVSAVDDAYSVAEQYAPVLHFVGDEECFPVDVSYHLENSYLYEYSPSGSMLVSSNLSGDDLSGYTGGGYFLDNQQGTVSDLGIVRDYQQYKSMFGYTVYAHVFDYGSDVVVQYWFFYAFNLGSLNVHEGDWEMVQVVLSNNQPDVVMYSQHHSGQKARWSQVERLGSHMHVYVAEGSHANYFRSYSGQLGVATDHVGSDGVVLDPADYSLVLLENQSWLNFDGRWGVYGSEEDELRGMVGPPGPKFREAGEMWSDPGGWSSSLSMLDGNVLLVEWFLYHFMLIVLLITAAIVVVLGYRIYRRYKQHGLGPRVVSLLYIDGLNLKSLGNILCVVGIVIAVFGLINQWYGVEVAISSNEFETQGVVDLVVIDGVHGVQVNMLDSSQGLTQVGSFTFPFSLLLGIGLVLFIIGTIGVATSVVLGKRMIGRGIRLIIPIILILIIVMLLGSIALTSGFDVVDTTSGSVLGSISGAPFGGTEVVSLTEISEVTGSLYFRWGLRIGGVLLLIAAVIMIVAGVLMYTGKAEFFPQKKNVETKNEPIKENTE